ncbi:energy transducer TonB [Bacteriovoracaceae bacterium]|nr:energy transducer TonB [Bacteriovoracaceae bacterium]
MERSFYVSLFLGILLHSSIFFNWRKIENKVLLKPEIAISIYRSKGNQIVNPIIDIKKEVRQNINRGKKTFSKVSNSVNQIKKTTTINHGIKLLYSPKPSYPLQARKQHIEGEVWVKVTFFKDGHSSDIKLEKGSGEYLLDKSALAAAKRSQFSVNAEDCGLCEYILKYKFKIRS